MITLTTYELVKALGSLMRPDQVLRNSAALSRAQATHPLKTL